MVKTFKRNLQHKILFNNNNNNKKLKTMTAFGKEVAILNIKNYKKQSRIKPQAQYLILMFFMKIYSLSPTPKQGHKGSTTIWQKYSEI